MSSMRTNARLDTSPHGLPHPLRIVWQASEQRIGEVPLRRQQELYTQGFLDVPAGKYPEDSSMAGVEAIVLLGTSRKHS
jgi:hypothetical protein